MSQKLKESLVDDQIELLVKHFGRAQVRAAFERVANGVVRTSEGQRRVRSSKPNRQSGPSVKTLLEQVRKSNEKKYHLLAGFYAELKDKSILPEAQDMRHFAQLIGLKEIRGKSRKGMIPSLMRFLAEQTAERIQVDIEAAASVSEQQRQMGFSVITDKLLGQKPETEPDVEF
jgi:hypothetical protein